MNVEGKNAVSELLGTDKAIEKIMLEKGARGTLSRIFAQARARGIKVQFVDRRALDKLSATGMHQGVIAVTTDFKYADIEDIIAAKGEKGGFVILCDGIEDVHNLGSIIRVAECTGADGVIIPANNSASVTEAVIRISAGAANHVKVAKTQSLNRAVDRLKQCGYWLYALEADGESIYDADLTGNIALVVGGEDSGVKKLTREKCDFVLSLPMKGKVNSLNASVALGVACYEALRKRS